MFDFSRFSNRDNDKVISSHFLMIFNFKSCLSSQGHTGYVQGRGTKQSW